jgi:hypothetical protein
MNKYQIKRTRTIETEVLIEATSVHEAEATYKALLLDGTIDTIELESWSGDDTYEILNVESIQESDDFPKTDYVLYDRGNNSLYKDSYGRIIVYGDRREAEADCYGNELVISCNQLPSDLRRELLNQINNEQ